VLLTGVLGCLLRKVCVLTLLVFLRLHLH
jgi:hypothetical protein